MGKISKYLEHAAECALAGERKTMTWPRNWTATVGYMSLTWSDDCFEDFDSPEHECIGLCLAAAIAKADGA